MDRTIVEDYLRPVVSDGVAHYTRIGTLCHFIPSPVVPGAQGWQSAWATPVQFLNDRAELSLGLNVLREVANRPPNAASRVRNIIENLLTSVGRLETDAFQMSFSGNPDELGQWRGYAANGMGCSILTDALEVKQVSDVAGWVIYNPRKQKAFARKVLERLRHEPNNNIVEQTIVASASFMKDEGFQPENEFRLLKFPDLVDVRFRESGDRLVPYVDYLHGSSGLPVSDIKIGPGWQLKGLGAAEWARNHVVQGIDRMLRARGLPGVTISASRIPYDPK